MISDNDRREAARRLRTVAKKLGPNMDAHEFAHYTADVLDVDDSMTWCEMELRLADLIEPSEPKVRCVAEVKVDGERLEELVHDAVAELTGIDRDALLTLADEMLSVSIGISSADSIRPLEAAYIVQGYARRIREALGVDDGR